MKVDVYTSWQRIGLLAVLVLVVPATICWSLLPGSNLDGYDRTAKALDLQLAAFEKREFAPKFEEFPFDPNVVTKEELLRLGVSAKRADSWLRFRGNRPNAFRKPEDIGKLRVLSEELKQRLIPLAFVPPASDAGDGARVQSFEFDPNEVTSDQLVQLGLRPYQAKIYLNYRSKVPGGFSDVAQIRKLKFLEEEQKDHLSALARFPDPPPKEALTLKDQFTFDPNLVSADSFQLLGFPEYQAKALLRYRGDRRATFRKPEDLRRVRSLDSGLVDLVTPLIVIASFPPGAEPAAAPKLYASKPLPSPASIDVNLADTTLLKSLPGIGSYRAKKLIRFRELLGGFYELEQVGTTRGLPDSTFQNILPYLSLSPVFRKMSINQADAEELKRHPYINSKLAVTVVRFRDKHGGFSGADDLRQIRLLNDENLLKILPYLSFE